MARILVIDDQAPVRSAVRLVLERAQHRVREEPDGHVALRHFAGDPTDLIITDVFMPHMDGIDFIMRVKGAFPEARVIVMSGGSLISKEEILADAADLGADATLAKPFSPEELLELVDRVLATTPRPVEA